MNVEANIAIEFISENKEYKCDCGKKYIDNSGLRKHKLKCKLLTVDSKFEDKDNEIAMLKNKIAQYEVRHKKLVNKNEELVKIHADEIQKKDDEIHALKLAVTVPAVTVPAVTVSNKIKADDFLLKKCANAINLETFSKNFQVDEDDFDAEEMADSAQWLVNIIHRNTKNMDVTERPFHIFFNTNTHKSILYYLRENEWVECDDEGVRNFIRRVIMNIRSKLMSMQKNETLNKLIYDKETYTPEKDDDGEYIEKNWDDHNPKSPILDELDCFKMVIGDLSSNNKNVLKLMRDKYTIQ